MFRPVLGGYQKWPQTVIRATLKIQDPGSQKIQRPSSGNTMVLKRVKDPNSGNNHGSQKMLEIFQITGHKFANSMSVLRWNRRFFKDIEISKDCDGSVQHWFRLVLGGYILIYPPGNFKYKIK
jgi:hypothetical protein